VQLSDGAFPVQLPPIGSVTTTVPLGDPPDEVTVKLTVMGAAKSEGSGLSAVIVTVVLAGGGALASALWLLLSVAPPLSVTVSVTWYLPGAAYECDGFGSLELCPSPKSQCDPAIVPSSSVL
jgi:hypothetical protein